MTAIFSWIASAIAGVATALAEMVMAAIIAIVKNMIMELISPILEALGIVRLVPFPV